VQTLEYSYLEKERAEWGEGEWNNEPDKVQWQDEETGLPCLVVRSPMGGNWCGYVGVSVFRRVYRTIEYVRNETRELAKQLAAVA
jgi:hypothetical protein